ncbi:MAG: hypothetical protein M3O02_03285 [Acidobacteriota bacterium]|nr:hypothetical protein [Acidobacteriota bacterium]
MNERTIPAEPAGAGLTRVCSAIVRTLLPAWKCPLVSPRARRRTATPHTALLLCLTLAGCTHKARWTPPPSLTAPIELEPPPESSTPPMIAAIPPPEWTPTEPAEPPKRPVRRRPAPTPPREGAPAQPPTQVASGPEPAELAIGSLSSGGETTPQAHQQARDLIAAIQKRVSALPRSTATQQKAQIRQVTGFLKHAQQALDSGDAEGAVTLATKARLIMDDIEKK